ncbi:MAG TPA: cytochrome c peroxidase [Vicinamibacterales bacterium]|nr:cytochrome c peroxidase [Vicinamibacterales bacterium]
MGGPSRRAFVTLLFVWATALTAAQSPVEQSQQLPPPPAPPKPIVVHTVVGEPQRFVTREVRPRLMSAMTPLGVPADNQPTDEKVALGRRLFFDKILSNDRTVSCATCHDPERAFADTKALAVGVSGRVGKRHSPSLINRAFGRAHFWDGRAATLEAQVVQPISDRNEMDLPLEDAVARVAGDRTYREAFQSVFGRPVSGEDLGRALATYLRTIRSTDSPYDRFVAGATDAMTPDQQQGLQIFRTKARCTFCHAEPLFTDEQFQNTGVAWQAESTSYLDDGRFMVSNQQRDRGKFKTPTLREIARTAPYMHDGSLATLEDVVDFYDKGGRPNQNLFPLIRPIGLTPTEKQQLIKFLEALSGTVTGK